MGVTIQDLLSELQGQRAILERLAPPPEQTDQVAIFLHQGPLAGGATTNRAQAGKIRRGPHNAVIFHLVPHGTSPSCAIQVVDSPNGETHWHNVLDTYGNPTGITTEFMFVVTGTRPWVSADLTITSGTWDVFATAVPIANQLSVTTTTTGTVTANQGTPNTAADAWPVVPVIGGTDAFTAGNPGIVDAGTDGGSAPSPLSAGTGLRGWLSSLAIAIQGAWVSAASALRVIPAKGSKTFTAVAVTTSAVQLAAANANRKSIGIVNNNASGGATLYLGKDNTVTTATGFPLLPGQPLGDATSTDAWWGISASTADARIVETT